MIILLTVKAKTKSMKQLILLVILLATSTLNFAQVDIPPLSQKQKVQQKVGFTEVTIEYCRPLMRGRKIFGGLEKYGEVWRTGANRNTQITFSEPITIGDTELKADTYTLFTRPNPDQWEVYFYPYDNGYGVPENFDAAKALATLTVPVFDLNRNVENLTINLENVTDNSADLSLMWERSYIAIPIKFTTEEKILKVIDNIVNSHSGEYYSAAKYYLDQEKDLEVAKELIQKSIDLSEGPGGSPKFWKYQMKAEILLANNEKKEALKYATKAMEMAASRGPDDYYVKEIKELLKQLK